MSTSTLYGGTYNLFAHTFPQLGVETRFVGPNDFDAIAAQIDERTKAVYCESIGNPAGNVADVERIAEVAHARGVPVIVDNTVPTPYLSRPFEHGADVVVHSVTKYIGGHGTIIGGALVDSGRFDWAANAERFPSLTQPDPSYHGMVYTEAVGELAYIVRARVVPPPQHRRRDLAPHRLPRPPGAGDAPVADGPHLRQRPGGGGAPSAAPAGRVGALRGTDRQPGAAAPSEVRGRACGGDPQLRDQGRTRRRRAVH